MIKVVLLFKHSCKNRYHLLLLRCVYSKDILHVNQNCKNKCHLLLTGLIYCKDFLQIKHNCKNMCHWTVKTDVICYWLDTITAKMPCTSTTHKNWCFLFLTEHWISEDDIHISYNHKNNVTLSWSKISMSSTVISTDVSCIWLDMITVKMSFCQQQA